MSGSAPYRLAQYRQRVRAEWIDYNGHLSEAYYVLVFGFATDAMMERLGLDSAYRQRTGASLYTVEAHVRYLHEVGVDAELAVDTRIIEAGAKKLRFCHEMRREGTLLATEELMALHVGGPEGRAVAFPDDVRERFTELREPAPEYAGRAIG